MMTPRERQWALLQGAFVLLTVVLDPLPEVSQSIRIEPEVEAVEFGKPFALVVERRWSVGLDAQPWDDAALAPLVVVETDRRSRSEDDVVVETIRFDAFAFERDFVRVDKPRWGASSTSGDVIPAVGAEFELRVTSSLPADDAGIPELPGGPFAEPRARWPWALAIGVALLGLGGLVLRALRKPRTDLAVRPVDRAAAWRARVDAIDREPRNTAIEEFARLVREASNDERGFPARERTTEEFVAWLAGAARVEPAARADAESVLRLADRVKFADGHATAADVDAARSATHAFVRALLAAAERRA